MWLSRFILSSQFSILNFLALCLCVSAVSLSCSRQPSDMRTLVPADSLIYLETNDLGAALQPVIDSKPFTEAAKYKPDLSPLKGVQIAVAVTGFETSEEKVDEDTSVGRIQPRFVAIADTHAWNFQTVKFAEQKLGSFVAQVYDSEPTLERSDKDGGSYFTWTAPGGRKAYALVIDSLIYFANDESSIEKCLAVRRGLADGIIKNDKVQPADPATLTRGYITTDGVAQIANLAALKAATATTDDGDMRSTIAVLLPKMIRESVSDVRWESVRSQTGIEDRFAVTLAPTRPEEANEVLSELVDSFFDDIETTSAEDVASALSDANDRTAPNTVHRSEDRFTATTAERRITTDLGFIGWIIAQLNED
jgi:hypothetical protein